MTTPAPLALTVCPAAASKYVLAAASATPAAGRDRRPHDHRAGHLRQHGDRSQRIPQPGLLRCLRQRRRQPADRDRLQRHRDRLRQRDRDRVQRRCRGRRRGRRRHDDALQKRLHRRQSDRGFDHRPRLRSTVTVSPGAAAKLVLTASTATPVAAANFNLTTTAQDAYGNTATTYAGSKSIVFSGASASPSGALPTVVNSAGTAVAFGSRDRAQLHRRRRRRGVLEKRLRETEQSGRDERRGDRRHADHPDAARAHGRGRHPPPNSPLPSSSPAPGRSARPASSPARSPRSATPAPSKPASASPTASATSSPTSAPAKTSPSPSPAGGTIAGSPLAIAATGARRLDHRIHLHRSGQRHLQPHDHGGLERLLQRHRHRQQIDPARVIELGGQIPLPVLTLPRR